MGSSYQPIPSQRNTVKKQAQKLGINLIIVIVVTLTLLASFLIGVISFMIFSEALGKYEVFCSHPGCIKIGTDFLSSMNLEADPCDNFFEFSCGNMFKFSPVAPHIARDELSELKYKQILEVLSEPVSDDDQLVVKNAKIMFSNCVKQDSNEIDSILRDIYGWPIVDRHQWQKSAFNWTKFDMMCHKMGILNGAFINFDFSQGNKSHPMIRLSAPEFLILTSNSWDIDAVSVKSNGLFNLAMKMASVLGVPADEAEPDLSAAVKLEQKLRNVTGTGSSEVSIRNLLEKYPQINWLEYINQMLPNEMEVDLNQTVSVEMNYLDNLFKVIDSGSKKDQSNYAISKVLADIWNNFLKNSRDDPQIPKWKKCIEFINPIFYEAINFMYHKKFLTLNTEHKIIRIIQNVSKEMLETFIKPNYPQCETDSNIVQSQLLSDIVPSYERLLNRAARKRIANLQLDEKSFIRNMLKIAKFAQDNFMTLKDVFDNKVQVEHIKASEMALSPLVFQDPLYIDDSPNFMKYGSFGGFVGSLMVNKMEGCPSLQLEKSNHNMCIAAEYEKKTGNKAKNNRTWLAIETNENQMGLESAYFAYNKLAEKDQPERKVVGLYYSNQEMFWISSARAFCMDKFAYVIDRNIDVPFEYQFNRFFASIPSFLKDFNCLANSTMNPKNTCRRQL